MLTHPQVQRYSTETGLRDIMIAENEIVLTYLLQLMTERGILDKFAFSPSLSGSFQRFNSSMSSRKPFLQVFVSVICRSWHRHDQSGAKTELLSNCLWRIIEWRVKKSEFPEPELPEHQ